MKFAPLLFLFLIGCAEVEEQIEEVDPRIKRQLMIEKEEFKTKKIVNIYNEDRNYRIDFDDGTSVCVKIYKKEK